MICIHCRTPLFPDYEVTGDEKRWIDKEWGEDSCYDAKTQSHPQTTRHSPAYEISGALLDDIVDYLGELCEILDRIGEEGVEQVAQLSEIVASEPKLVGE